MANSNDTGYPDQENGRVFKLRNDHILKMDNDYLHHLSLNTETHNLEAMFHDVKFVCMGGTAHRMANFAHLVLEELGQRLPTGTQLLDISLKSHRFSMYKCGPVISVNHGIGIPSMSIVLHEMFKLLHHARVKNPIFLRVGTSGGLGLEPGTVVVSDNVVNGMLVNFHEVAVLGEMKQWPAVCDQALVDEIISCADGLDKSHKVVRGTTMSTDDFYEGQGRLDGALCEYTKEDKFDFLRKLKSMGVVNIEMEGVAFIALCHRAGIKGGVICVTLVDRFQGDQITEPKSLLEEWQMRPQKLAAKFIKKCLDENCS